MRFIALVVVGVLVLFPFESLHAAAPSDAAIRDKATALLMKLQADISTVQTSSLIDFSNFRNAPVTGKSLREGWTTYYRYGDVRFRDRHGGGFVITPERDSIAILRPDSIYISLTVASHQAILPANKTFDLAPYLPGCRLYVYYRENFIGQGFQSDMHETMTEGRIYRKIRQNLAKFGVSSP